MKAKKVASVRENPIVRSEQRRSRMKVKQPETMITDAFKLTNGWTCCKKCDRIVKNIYNHQYADVCVRTNDSKRVSSSGRKQTTNDVMTLIYKLRPWYLDKYCS